MNSVVGVVNKNMCRSMRFELFKTRNFSKVPTTTPFVQLGNIATALLVHFVCLLGCKNGAPVNNGIPTLFGPIFDVLKNSGPGMEANKTDWTCCTMNILVHGVLNTMT